jgi:hypothetical protein
MEHRSAWANDGMSHFVPRTLEAKIRHHKFFDERLNHAAHMVCWHKVVQHHRKSRSSISSLALDVAHMSEYVHLSRQSSHL